jgi:hypothetical protein
MHKCAPVCVKFANNRNSDDYTPRSSSAVWPTFTHTISHTDTNLACVSLDIFQKGTPASAMSIGVFTFNGESISKVASNLVIYNCLCRSVGQEIAIFKIQICNKPLL